MNRAKCLLLVVTSLVLVGCTFSNRTAQHRSTSLVEFLYAKDQTPPTENAIPELRLPLRIGLAFLPTGAKNFGGDFDPALRETILERVRQHFAARKFVREIVIIPEYYLASMSGFDGLGSLQRLYGVDLVALVSYDQVTHLEDNDWSLSYLTIVGAYVVKGSRHEVATLVDLAVVDPASRSLLLRAGGVGRRHGNTTLVERGREVRHAGGDALRDASEQMIVNFDVALTRFEADIKSGKAQVRVAQRDGGGGKLTLGWIVLLASLALASTIARSRRALLRANVP